MNPCLSANRAARQRGFTMVELVTVILVLGVLAAVALPRYADLQGKAREAKVKGLFGAVKSSSATVKATALTQAVSCGAATGTSVSLEGLSVDLNYCYPQALASMSGGILGASRVEAADGWVIDGTKVGGAAAGTAVQINLSDAPTPGNCSISYTSSAAAASPPTIAVSTSGC